MWNKVVQVGHLFSLFHPGDDDYVDYNEDDLDDQSDLGHLFPLFHPAHIGDDDDDDYADYKDGDHDNDHEDGDYNEDDLDDLFSFSPCVNSR